MNTRQFITAGLIASVMTFVGSAAAQEPEAADASVEKRQKEPSPLLAPGLQAADANYTDAEKAELDALEALVRRFTDSAESYRKSARELIEHKFNKKRNLLVNYYEDAVQQLRRRAARQPFASHRAVRKFCSQPSRWRRLHRRRHV